MENRTTIVEMFHALRDTQIDLADSIVQLARLVIGSLLLLLCTLGIMLYQWISHALLAPLCIGLLVVALAGICWAWFALPSDIDELISDSAVREFEEK